jgi:hypothetical protein
MKTTKLILSLIAVLGVSALSAVSAHATTWYVRDGGGTKVQCTGTTNAVYPGSGSAQACAFNHPGYILGWGCTSITNCDANPIISSGDTLYIDGDSDVTPGAQAQYEIGYDSTNPSGFFHETYGNCVSSSTYVCNMGNLPAGLSSAVRTSIIGTGTHKPQLWGTQRITQVLSADNNHVWLQWLEITDHQACAFNDPTGACDYSASPYGPWAVDGLYLGGDDVNVTDVYVHGLGRYG